MRRRRPSLGWRPSPCQGGSSLLLKPAAAHSSSRELLRPWLGCWMDLRRPLSARYASGSASRSVFQGVSWLLSSITWLYLGGIRGGQYGPARNAGPSKSQIERESMHSSTSGSRMRDGLRDQGKAERRKSPAVGGEAMESGRRKSSTALGCHGVGEEKDSSRWRRSQQGAYVKTEEGSPNH